MRIQKKRADHHDLPVFLVVGLEKISWFRAILIVTIRNIMSGYTGPAAMMTIAHLSELKNYNQMEMVLRSCCAPNCKRTGL